MAAKGSRKKRSSLKKPQSPIALATSDFVGNTVICTEETWMHVSKHGITDLSILKKAVEDPMRVRASTVPHYTNAFAFETLTDKTYEHVRALVYYPEGADIMKGSTTGQVKTIYPVDYTSPSRVGAVVFESPNSTLPDPEKSK